MIAVNENAIFLTRRARRALREQLHRRLSTTIVSLGCEQAPIMLDIRIQNEDVERFHGFFVSEIVKRVTPGKVSNATVIVERPSAPAQLAAIVSSIPMFDRNRQRLGAHPF